jgi:hypothetical protein
MVAQKIREILGPVSKLAGGQASRIVSRIVQNAKDLVGQELGHRASHSEPPREKVDWMLAKGGKRITLIIIRIRPGIKVVQPTKNIYVSHSRQKKRERSHVDKYNA